MQWPCEGAKNSFFKSIILCNNELSVCFMRIDGLEKFEKQNDIMTPEAKFGSTVYILFSIE